MTHRGQLGDYVNSKIVGHLHFAHVAKQHPELYVVGTSPGAIGGSYFEREERPRRLSVESLGGE